MYITTNRACDPLNIYPSLGFAPKFGPWCLISTLAPLISGYFFIASLPSIWFPVGLISPLGPACRLGFAPGMLAPNACSKSSSTWAWSIGGLGVQRRRAQSRPMMQATVVTTVMTASTARTGPKEPFEWEEGCAEMGGGYDTRG